MAQKISRDLCAWSALSVIRDKRERCNCPQVSGDMSTFSTATCVLFYSSDIPSILHPKFSDSPLNFRTLPQQIQRGNASQHSGTLEYPYVGQHQIIYPSQITKTFFHGRRQSASLPQDSLGPHPQSQARVKSKPLGYVFRKNISFRRPPKAVTMRPRRGVVHKSWSRVTSLPLR